jgi:lipid II:glycine glycyltransferase (peptidoglycan interpeptide bridge formation enzyme)
MERIVKDAHKEGCMVLHTSPVTAMEIPGARPSERHVHCEATRIVDLTATEEEILAQMKQKGRYNIRLAEKGGVTVQECTDVAAFAALAQQTGSRDGFTALPKARYEAFLRALPGSFLLLAYDTQKTPVAGLLGVVWNGRGIYYYGASSYAHRALMAPYALQWAAIRHCKAQGCHSYDLLGIAPPSAGEDHPWAGITRFKEQFGGTVHTYPAEQELVLRPIAKTLLDWKRRILG